MTRTLLITEPSKGPPRSVLLSAQPNAVDASHPVVLQESPLRVAIGIITYKRPKGLSRLLNSIEALDFDQWRQPKLSVVIVDNDVEASAKPICEELAGAGLAVQYRVESTRGIPSARNAVLEAALDKSDFIAFIDDDEVAEPKWLDELLRIQRSTGADVVAGPVLPRVDLGAPEWLRDGRLFHRKRYVTGTRVQYVATNNVLVRSDLIQTSGIRFDVRLAMSGGSDTLFFMRLASLGAKMVWADEAVVYETIPRTRATTSWLYRRAYRQGVAFSQCESILGLPTAQRAYYLAKRLARMAQGLGMLLVGALVGRRIAVAGLQHLARGLGYIAGLFGGRYDEYRVTHGE